MKRLVLLWAATSALAGFAAGGDLSVGAADVQEVFENPPAKAHTGVWWHWMGSQVTEAGIVADLDYFRRVGISSATIFGMTDVCTPWAKAIPGSPHDGLLPFSDAWWKLVKFACVEAGKRGIELGVHNCPGYTSTGGPWIPPALAMRELVFNVTNVEAQISLEPHAPYPIYLKDKGRYGLPDVPARRSDFREIAVVRGVRVGHVPMGSFTQPNPQAVFGLECDKMNPEAVAFHLDHVIGEMKRHLGDELGKSLTFVLLDSYEAGRPTWTPHLREEFLKRRGYDPLDYLPVLGGYTNLYTAAEVARFRRDFDRTVADLYRDVLFKMMRDKLHAVGLEFACEPYEGPFVPRECAAYVDRLMTEFWFRPPERTDDYSPIPDGWNRWLRADGVRHNVIEAEAFTGQPSDCRWNETMAAIKACGDQHYLRGVNRFTLHSNPHQPWGDDVLPGVAMISAVTGIGALPACLIMLAVMAAYVFFGGMKGASVAGLLKADNRESKLNANLVLGDATGTVGRAVLDVSAMEGEGGLWMGSSVTLNPMQVELSERDLELVSALGKNERYDLFNGVDQFLIAEEEYTQLGLGDTWVDAATVFSNIDQTNKYYLFYTGESAIGGKGGQMGTVYLLQIPEPTTGTLSLLALCALAARRRRK